MNEYLSFLYDVMMKKRKLQSDFARENAMFVAEAASRGHISSIICGEAKNSWFLTGKGYELLKSSGCL